jgi:flagellar biosynthetic protein FlhB
MAGEKTEKATPKKLDQAREKGQIARSMDLNGAVVLIASLITLSATGPKLFIRIEEATVAILRLVASPEIVSRDGFGVVMADAATHVGIALAPVLLSCLIAGVVINVLQTGGKPSTKAIMPQWKKLNPLTGAKNLLGPNSLVEAAKGVFKVAVVGTVAAMALIPKLPELGALVGMAPAELLTTIAGEAFRIAQWAAGAYLVIALADLVYQRWHFGKQMRMEKQEVKEENKQMDLPPEVKAAIRRRQMDAARQRMMDAVPTADVIVTNPTHYSVALRYDSERLAPVVVAKGKDNIAFKIRELARDAGVAIVPDPPLARTLHASVEVGQMIPEELFQAVAQLLAYVYRLAGRKAAAAGAAA